MALSENNHADVASRLQAMEKHEQRLWRVSLLMLALLAFSTAGSTWETLRNLPARLAALPIGVVVLVVLFALYVIKEKRAASKLRAELDAARKSPGPELPPDELTAVVMRSQRSYRELIDSFGDVVLSIDLEGRIKTANRSLTDLVGLQFNQVVGHRVDEFFDEPSLDELAQGLPEFMEKRHWAGMQRIRVKGSADIRYFDCVLRPVLAEGEVTGVSVLGRDITAEREREARFTGLFETLQEGVYFTNPEGQLVDINQALATILGYDNKHDLLTKNTRDLFIDPADRDALHAKIDASGSIQHEEIRLKRKDGSMVICLDSSSAVRDVDGQIIRYQGTLLDITSSRSTEARLREEQEFRRRLVESFPDMILVLGCDCRYTYVSPRVQQMLGYSPEEMIGKKMGETARNDKEQELMKAFEDMVSGKVSFASVEYEAQHRSGEWRTLRASASPLFNDKNQVEGVIASVSDITLLKQLGHQVVHTERQAAMGQMISGFAHELNNPLTAVLGASELLQQDVKDEGLQRTLHLLNQQARRAADIVQNLLFFSRPPQPGKALLSMNDIVQRTLQLHEYSLRTNNIHVDFQPAEGLEKFRGDPNQLMQVFLNLIKNAEQAIREVKASGTLRIRVSQAKDKVQISFQDDGPGIKPEVMPQIFDPFFTTKRPGGGIGLGLSICMAVLKEYGAAIDVASPAGGGALFTVSLPIRTPSTIIATSQVATVN